MIMSSDLFFFLLYDLFNRIFYRYIVKPTYIIKLLIIGDREVGRRTFLRDSRDHFFNKGCIDIIGVELYRKELTVEENVIDFMIWAVSNDDRFRRDLRTFISGSNAAILMFDITRVGSYNFLSDFPGLIRQYAGDIPILLVGNKKDLEEVREVSGEGARTIEGHNNLLGYLEISAKNGQNCEGIFTMLGEKILRQLQLH